MRLQKCFIAAAAVILAGPLGQAQQTFRVATYNVENFILEPIQNRPLKKPFAQAKIVESILAARPDVIALQEVLPDLRDRLLEADWVREQAVLAEGVGVAGAEVGCWA